MKSIFFTTIFSALLISNSSLTIAETRDIKGLRLGMTKAEVKTVLDKSADTIVGSSELTYSMRDLHNRPIPESAHFGGWVYTISRKPRELIQVMHARKPMDETAISIYREFRDTATPRPLEAYKKSLITKYGEPKAEQKVSNSYRFLWTTDDAPESCNQLIDVFSINIPPNKHINSGPQYPRNAKLANQFKDCGAVLIASLSVYENQPGTPVHGLTQQEFDPAMILKEASTNIEYWNKWVNEYEAKRSSEAGVPEL